MREQKETLEIKQIQDLKGRLFKSYKSTIESVRHAQELEKETDELNKAAKKSPEKKKLPRET